MTDTKHSATTRAIERIISGGLNMGWISDAEASDIRAAIAAAAPIPEGCARAWNGTIYHNITEIYHRMEEGEALHMVLDEKNVPRADADGAIYSLVGRVARLSEAAPKAALTTEQIIAIIQKFDADASHGLDYSALIGDEIITFARAIEAASGPNAALVEALKVAKRAMGYIGCEPHQIDMKEDHDEPMAIINAALAAAGVSHEQ